MPEPKQKSVTRKTVMKSPELLASETLLAVTTSETGQEAADKLGISRQHLYRRIKEYGLTDKILVLREDALNELTLGSMKAAQKLVKLIDSDNETIAKGASESVLDRAGVTKSDSSSNNTINNFGQMLLQQKGKYDD